MRYAWIVCLKDLRQRLRDRTALLVAVVVPLALSGIVGLALGSNRAGIELRVALAAPERGPRVEALREFLARPWLEGVVLLQHVESGEAAAALLADDRADAALVVRSGFDEASAPGPGADGPPPIEVLASGSNAFATRMTVALAERFLAESQHAAQQQGSDPLPEIVPLSPGGRLRTVDYYAFSMTVLFLTFSVLSGVRSLQQEVEAGVLSRLIASPASPRAVLGGKLLGLLLLGWLQMGVMIAATSLLFGTRWGEPLPVACLVFTSVWMAIGMTAFFMSLAANAEQGQTLASIAIFLLAIIGGQFMPPQGLPDVFDTLQRLTPNGQAHRGFMDAAAFADANSLGGGLASLAEPLLYTFAVGCAGIAFAGRRAAAALTRSLA